MATVDPVRGGERLEAYLSKLASKSRGSGTLRVGFLEDATYPNGESVATIAAIQNYGAPAAGIPARPFFTNMVNQKSGEWGGKLAKALNASDYDAPKALGFMGVFIAGELAQAIHDMNDPALSPVTLLLRQRFSDHSNITYADVEKAREDIASGAVPDVTPTQAKPLVWTGHMLQSISYEVTPGEVDDVTTSPQDGQSPSGVSRSPSPAKANRSGKNAKPGKVTSRERKAGLGGVYDEARGGKR